MRAMTIACLLLLLAVAGQGQRGNLLERGQPLPVAPEVLSGIWVAPDGVGGWLELRITFAARLPLAGSLANGPFLLEHINVGVCSGPSPEMRFGQCNYSTDDPGGGVRFGQDSLTIYAAAQLDFPGARVALRRDGDGWTGVFSRGKSVAQGALRRGDPGGLTGSWRSSTGGDCLHLAETPAGIVAWLDRMQAPSRHFANGVKPWPPLQNFGVIAGAERSSPGLLSIEIGGVNEGSSMAGGRTVYLRPQWLRRGHRRELVLTGMRSSDGRWVEPDWVRVRGESCRVGR